MKIVLPTFSDQFTWVKLTHGVCEASDFGTHFRGADTEFSVHVLDTAPGTKIIFSYDRTERDAEGDVVAWHYRSPNNLSLTVFND